MKEKLIQLGSIFLIVLVAIAVYNAVLEEPLEKLLKKQKSTPAIK